MSNDKKQQPTPPKPTPINEKNDFGKSVFIRDESNANIVSNRVVVPPAPPKPPKK